MDLIAEIQNELGHARTALIDGNIGLSRVCARRAAGLAVRDFLVNHGYQVLSSNNFELMKYPDPRKYLPEIVNLPLDHLTMSVDMDHNLPPGIDLIQDAEFVINELIVKGKSMGSKQIKVYGTTWCGDTRRARQVFAEMAIEYEWIDIDQDQAAAELVKSLNNGYRSVPTIIFPDESVLVEPSGYQLRQKLDTLK